MERYIDKINPELSYTPERRRLEHKFIEEEIKGISKLNISEEKKQIVINLWLDHMFEYESKYFKYNQNKEDLIFEALSILN